MLSKCANPACFKEFRYLHTGKLFHLCPTPEVAALTLGYPPTLEERFWLCDSCCKQMTLAWGGDRAQLVDLPSRQVIELRPPRFRSHPTPFGWDVE